MATDKPMLGVGAPDNLSSSPINGSALRPLPSPYQLHHATPPSSGHASANGGRAGVGQDMMASLLAAAKRSVALPTAPAPSPGSLLGGGFAVGPPPPGRIVSSYPVPAAAAPVDAPAALALASLSRDSPQAQHALWGGLQHPAVAPFSGPAGPPPLPPGPGPTGGGYSFLPPPTSGAMNGSGLVAGLGVGTATTSTSTVSANSSMSSTASSGALPIKGEAGSNEVAWGFLRREGAEDVYDARLGAYGPAGQGEGVALGKRPRAQAAAVGGPLPAAGWPGPVKPPTTNGLSGSMLGSDGSIGSADGAHGLSQRGIAAALSLSAEERLTVTRERNRDHSRKSRQRKKQYIQGLQQQVDDLGLFKLLVEQAADPISMNTADEKLTVLYASPAYQRELGYDPIVLQEQRIDFNKLVNPDDLPRLLQQVRKALVFGEAPKVALRVRHASGRMENAEVSLRLMPGRQMALVLRLRGLDAGAS